MNSISYTYMPSSLSSFVFVNVADEEEIEKIRAIEGVLRVRTMK